MPMVAGPTPGETTKVIRPAAVLREQEAAKLQAALEANDVSRGGVWNVGPGLWQRYDQPWDGVAGMTGSARLMGTIGVIYGSPARVAEDIAALDRLGLGGIIAVFRMGPMPHALATQNLELFMRQVAPQFRS